MLHQDDAAGTLLPRGVYLQVATILGLGEPRRQGKEYVVHCPLHTDRRPSLRLNPARNAWYCDPCAQGGDGISLIMRAERLDFAAAVRRLAA